MTIPPSKLGGSEPTASAPKTETQERGSGFTSVIRHLSLRGWLDWIHSNQSDATLSVRTRESGNGQIWCIGGTVVDAEWGGLPAQLALEQLLLLSSGSVTIDFDRVDHPRHIGGHEAARASLPGPSLPAASLPAPGPMPRRLTRSSYFTGLFGLAALAVAAFAFGRSRASGELTRAAAAPAVSAEEQVKSGLLPSAPVRALHQPEVMAATTAVPTEPVALELPLIAFAQIEIDPPYADILLDQEFVATGRIQQGPIRDGRLHELRFVAPGHETRSLFFRDTPPAGRVILERTPESDSEVSESIKDPPAARPVARRRSPPASVRARPVASPPSAPLQAQKPPQIQVIEEQTPRVQIVD